MRDTRRGAIYKIQIAALRANIRHHWHQAEEHKGKGHAAEVMGQRMLDELSRTEAQLLHHTGPEVLVQ